MNTTAFTLKPVAPFRLDYTVWAIRRRPANIVDRWDGVTWGRVHALPEGIFEVRVTEEGPAENPALRVRVLGDRASTDSIARIRGTLTRMLGLDRDLSGFYREVRGLPVMGVLSERFRGVRLPRFPSVFEALANGIACQQLSLAVGITLLNRVARTFGDRFDTPEGAFFGFPRPQRLARADAAALRALGFSRQKAGALIELSRRVSGKAVDLESLETMGSEDVRERLLQLKGIGRWTADYALLRGLGRFEIFPEGDVGARNRLKLLLHAAKPPDDRTIRRRLRKGEAYAGLIYIHLLLEGLSDQGLLSDGRLSGTR